MANSFFVLKMALHFTFIFEGYLLSIELQVSSYFVQHLNMSFRCFLALIFYVVNYDDCQYWHSFDVSFLLCHLSSITSVANIFFFVSIGKFLTVLPSNIISFSFSLYFLWKFKACMLDLLLCLRCHLDSFYIPSLSLSFWVCLSMRIFLTDLSSHSIFLPWSLLTILLNTCVGFLNLDYFIFIFRVLILFFYSSQLTAKFSILSSDFLNISNIITYILYLDVLQVYDFLYVVHMPCNFFIDHRTFTMNVAFIQRRFTLIHINKQDKNRSPYFGLRLN